VQEPTIGIKIANGSYFPIIEEKSVGKKRLILTTVKDRQESVKIDLYKSDQESLENAIYIGSLILESIETGGRGEPEIELILGTDEEGNLTATAGDLGSGERQSLSVALDTLAEESEFEIPDFDLDASIEPTSEVSSLEEGPFEEELLEEEPGDEELFGAEEEPFEEELDLGGIPEEEEPGEEELEEEPGDEELFGAEEEIEEEHEEEFEEELLEEEQSTESSAEAQEEPRRRRPGLIAVFVFLGLVIIGLLAFLLYRSFQGEETPPLEARGEAPRTEQPAEPAEDEPAGEPAGKPADEAAAAADGSAGEEGPAAGPGDQAGMQDTETLGGVWYWVKWGDTLWDLSYSFYRTPWLYGMIAKVNNIKNPDLIYADSKLYIPEK